MAIRTEHELIFVIANEGYTDLVTDAARSAGASGGTVLKARGTGGSHSEKFFGFSIAEEKAQLDVLATQYDVEVDTQEINRIFQSLTEEIYLRFQHLLIHFRGIY